MSEQSFAPALLTVAAWLATFAIHSTILLLGAWLVDRRLGDRPDITSGVWKAAAIGGLVTASISIGFGVQPLAGRIEVPQVATDDPAPVVVERRVTSLAREPDAAIAELPVAPAEGLLRLHPPHHVEPPRAADAVPWPQWCVLAWMLAAFAAIGSLVAARLRLAAVMRSRASASPALQRQLAELCAGLPARVTPRLFATDRIVVPFAAGVLAPVIVLPTRASALSETAQRTMLAHELAHVIRRDPAWRLFLLVLERVLLFQPLLRLARRRVEHDAEYLCDAWAARRTEAPFELARCLTEVAGWVQVRRPPALVTTMAEPRSILRRRVMRLVAGAPVERSTWRTVPAVLAIGLVLPFVAPMVASAGPEVRRRTVVVVEAQDDVEVAVVRRSRAPRVIVLRDAEPPAEARPAAPPARIERAMRRRVQREVRRVPDVPREVPQIEEVVLELSDAPEDVELAAELDEIIAESEAIAELARARALARGERASRRIELRARALRDRAHAHRDAARAQRTRVRVLELAEVEAFAPPAPPSPPPLAEMPDFMAPIAPTRP